QAHDSPAPAHGPLTAAMVTLGISRSSWDDRMFLRSRAIWVSSEGWVPAATPSVAVAGPSDMPCRSPPAQKPRPAPVRMTARMLSSDAADARPAIVASSSPELLLWRFAG